MREPDSARARLHPETAVGGYSRMDGTAEFYNRVNTPLSSDSDVMDFGAGRGHWTPSRYANRVFDLQWLLAAIFMVFVQRST